MASPDRNGYDKKLEERAVKHRNLVDRNNVTVCRSPPRELDTKLMKNEQQRKRHEEFLKRRPADCGLSVVLSTPTRHIYSQEERVTQMSTSHRKHLFKSPGINPIKQPVSTPLMNDENRLKHERVTVVLSSLHKREKANKERAFQDITHLTNNQRTLHSASAQTELGIATVNEADVQQLGIYLEEALYREGVLKKKLAALQMSNATLIRSTEMLWKTRCDEDLLKNKIKALEDQLQLFIKKTPQDGLKKVVLQIEKQKMEYEQKALQAIQKATEENSEAQSKMLNLQEALQTAQAESVRWQKLYEEQIEFADLLKKNQALCSDQLLQLQNQLEHSRGQEESLRKQCDNLQQDGLELRSTITLLEEDNQILKEQLKELTENTHESWNNITEVNKLEQFSHQVFGTDNNIAKQLCQAEQRLSLKEKECVELKTELEILEQECYSSQTRLAKCREELNTLTARNSRSTKKRCSCGAIFCFFLFFLLMLVAVLSTICIYSPSVMDQFQDFCSAVLEKVEDYLLLAASPQHSGHFKPI
ncbi:TRAF3-interacting JNK-activating modulator [Trichomycterus rosablanca]|uniref:TRAF3-interacting JNK-activating modulator n=1 Tax=Trichomycterus rosablanca TaxID=2290929 RepID=UPI002F354B0B